MKIILLATILLQSAFVFADAQDDFLAAQAREADKAASVRLNQIVGVKIAKVHAAIKFQGWNVADFSVSVDPNSRRAFFSTLDPNAPNQITCEVFRGTPDERQQYFSHFTLPDDEGIVRDMEIMKCLSK